MGYRDDFYTTANIIGYTGQVDDWPTIYFADAGGTDPKLKTVRVGDRDVQKVVVQFGHITTFHDIADNIGREQVGEGWSYSIVNVVIDGKLHAEECFHKVEADSGYASQFGDKGHREFHTSRNQFLPVGPKDVAVLKSLGTYVGVFTKLKPRYKS